MQQNMTLHRMNAYADVMRPVCIGVITAGSWSDKRILLYTVTGKTCSFLPSNRKHFDCSFAVNFLLSLCYCRLMFLFRKCYKATRYFKPYFLDKRKKIVKKNNTTQVLSLFSTESTRVGGGGDSFCSQCQSSACWGNLLHVVPDDGKTMCSAR